MRKNSLQTALVYFMTGCMAVSGIMPASALTAQGKSRNADTGQETILEDTESTGLPSSEITDPGFDIYYAENAAEMAAAVQTLDDSADTRLTVSTEQSIAAEIPEGRAVYYNGTYIMQFNSSEDSQTAMSVLDRNGAGVSADTVFTICKDETGEPDTEIIESPEEDTVDAGSEETDDEQNDTEFGKENQTDDRQKDDSSSGDTEKTGNDSGNVSGQEEVKPDTIEDRIDQDTLDVADAGLSSDKDKSVKTVALIDTGVTGEDADLEINFTNDDTVTNDHGTRMAEQIKSIAGDHARIISLKAFNNDGTAASSNVYAAIQYAIDAEVDYISLSAAAENSSSLDPLRELLQKAAENGIRIIVSAGNDGNDAADYFPGCMEETDTVSAADDSWNVLETANDGECVDWYAVSDSTSEATARVTGMLVQTSSEEMTEDEIQEKYRIVSAERFASMKEDPDPDESGNVLMDKDQKHVTNGAAQWKTTGALATYRFDYTGAVQKWTVPESGEYYFHLFGGTGGYLTQPEADKLGLERLYVTYGRGGETDATVNLEKGQVLYLAVGGSGKASVADPKTVTNQSSLTAQGGWNGGGSTSGNGAGSGGGATHVAYKDGLLSTLSDSDLLLVAGGGGGRGSEDDQGIGGIGAGGGTSGENAKCRQDVIASGGSQIDGYKRGIGESASVTRGAGGGGYYGGHACSMDTFGGAGGSGYINESVVTEGWTTTRGNSYDDGYIVIEYNGKAKSIVTIDAGSNGTVYGDSTVTITGTVGEKAALPKPVTKESYIQFTGYTVESGNGTIASDGITFTYGTKPTRLLAQYEGTTASLNVTQNGDTAYASVTAKSVSNTKVYLQGTADLNGAWTNLAQFALDGKVTSYPSSSLRQYVVNGANGTFTVQVPGTYKFYIAGANGGRDGNFWYGWAKQNTSYGGTGASMTFSAHLKAGDVVKLYSSTKGQDSTSYAKGGSGYRRGGNNTDSETTAGGGGASAIEVNGKVVAVAAGGAGADWTPPNPGLSGHISTDTSIDFATNDDTAKDSATGGQGGDSRVSNGAGGGAGWRGGMMRPNESVYSEYNGEYCFWSSYWDCDETDWAGSYGGMNGYDATAVDGFHLIEEKAQWAGRNGEVEIIDGRTRGQGNKFAIKLNSQLSEQATWLPVPEWVASEFGTTSSSLSNTLHGNGIATVSLLQKDLEEVPADGKTQVQVKIPDNVAPGIPSESYLSGVSSDYTTQTVSLETTEDQGGHYWFRVKDYTDAKETSYVSGFKGWYYITDTQKTVSADFVRTKAAAGSTTFTASNTATHKTAQTTEYMHIATVDNAGNISDCVTVELPPYNRYALPQTAVRVYYHSNFPNEDDTVYTDRVLVAEGEDTYAVLKYEETSLGQKTTYKFKGWNTSADGSGTSYAAGSSQSAKTMDKKDLYAQWEKQYYTVHFDKNAADATGTMSDMTNVSPGVATPLPENKYTRKGYEFAGWSTKTTGYPQYKDKDNILDLAEAGKTATLYAVWKPAYTINVYVKDGNSADYPSKPNYTYTGYAMTGDQVNADTKIKDLALDGYTLAKITNASGQTIQSTTIQVSDTASGNSINLYYTGTDGIVYFSLITGANTYYPGELSHEWLGTAVKFSSIPAAEKNGNTVTNSAGIEKYLKKIPTDQVDAYLESKGLSSDDVIWVTYKLASDGDYHVYGAVKNYDIRVIYHSNFGTDKTFEETLTTDVLNDGKAGVTLKSYKETGLPDSHKRFQYWTENKDGTGTAYNTMEKTAADYTSSTFYPAFESKTINLYAQWDENSGFVIEKRDKNTNALIGNAEFSIYTSAGTKYMDVSVGSSGKSQTFYLPKGTYTVRETKAPDGYMLAADIQITSNATGYKADDQTIVSASVKDAKLTNLPSAGGMGRKWIYVAAGVLAGIAVYAAVRKRK